MQSPKLAALDTKLSDQQQNTSNITVAKLKPICKFMAISGLTGQKFYSNVKVKQCWKTGQKLYSNVKVKQCWKTGQKFYSNVKVKQCWKTGQKLYSNVKVIQCWKTGQKL